MGMDLWSVLASTNNVITSSPELFSFAERLELKLYFRKLNLEYKTLETLAKNPNFPPTDFSYPLNVQSPSVDLQDRLDQLARNVHYRKLAIRPFVEASQFSKEEIRAFKNYQGYSQEEENSLEEIGWNFHQKHTFVDRFYFQEMVTELGFSDNYMGSFRVNSAVRESLENISFLGNHIWSWKRKFKNADEQRDQYLKQIIEDDDVYNLVRQSSTMKLPLLSWQFYDRVGDPSYGFSYGHIVEEYLRLSFE